MDNKSKGNIGKRFNISNIVIKNLPKSKLEDIKEKPDSPIGNKPTSAVENFLKNAKTAISTSGNNNNNEKNNDTEKKEDRGFLIQEVDDVDIKSRSYVRFSSISSVSSRFPSNRKGTSAVQSRETTSAIETTSKSSDTKKSKEVVKKAGYSNKSLPSRSRNIRQQRKLKILKNRTQNFLQQLKNDGFYCIAEILPKNKITNIDLNQDTEEKNQNAITRPNKVYVLNKNGGVFGAKPSVTERTRTSTTSKSPLASRGDVPTLCKLEGNSIAQSHFIVIFKHKTFYLKNLSADILSIMKSEFIYRGYSPRKREILALSTNVSIHIVGIVDQSETSNESEYEITFKLQTSETNTKDTEYKILSGGGTICLKDGILSVETNIGEFEDGLAKIYLHEGKFYIRDLTPNDPQIQLRIVPNQYAVIGHGDILTLGNDTDKIKFSVRTKLKKSSSLMLMPQGHGGVSTSVPSSPIFRPSFPKMSVSSASFNLKELALGNSSKKKVGYQIGHSIEGNFTKCEKMQDRATVIEDFFRGEECVSGSFLGIYDGHDVRNVADFVSTTFHETLYEVLQSNLPIVGKKPFGTTCHKSNIKKENEEEIIIESFRDSYARITQLVAGMGNTSKYGGTTACTALLWNNKANSDLDLYIANIGDSRAFLFSADDKITMLSEDHHTKNEQEAKRVRDAGGMIFRGRLGGCLTVTRAFGDTALVAQGLTSEPYIIKRTITKDDRFLILASDGLFDVISEKEVYEILKSSKDTVPQMASQLIEESIKRKTTDNISVALIKFL